MYRLGQYSSGLEELEGAKFNLSPPNNADPIYRHALKFYAPGWEPSPALKEFLETNFRRSLSSSQIFSILEYTSLPELEVFSMPKLDKSITDQIPKCY
jgi:hypothetical protein